MSLLTADSLEETQDASYWKSVCEQTREALSELAEEKDELSLKLDLEQKKTASLQVKVALMEAKLEAFKKVLADKYDVDIDISDDLEVIQASLVQ